MSLDEHGLTAWMKESVDGLHHPDRWDEVPTGAAEVTRRRRTRLIAAGGIAAAAAVIAVAVGVGWSSSQKHQVQVGHEPTVTTSPASPTAPATTVTPSPTPALPSGYLPLYPFSSGEEVARWETSKSLYLGYLNPGQTALGFARYLGYTGINEVLGIRSAYDGDHVAVGFTVASAPPHTVAVVHLVRFGPGDGAPWEVVGTDDTTLTLTSPPYGSRLQTPLSTGGTITGVDESITVEVFQAGSPTPVADSCCHAAGGTSSPWSVAIPGPLPDHGILIIAAATGGHIAPVERFAVTGVRPKQSSAP
jgi:hypothetical protein